MAATTKPFPKVEITWADATSRSSWGSLKNHLGQQPMEIESVGYLTKNDRKVVQIVQSKRDKYADDEDDTPVVADSLTIPKGWVRKIRRLR